MEMATATQTAAATVTATKWEKFMPRMKIRVLLVEADDSTRQVVAALLRKCSYRVEAVTDGLEAWEVLKKKPRNFDLILAEVELPAITGFALLTLIMEHDICRNVPVIMMSQGLDGNVYKCMQRGAADYLLKPIRESELRNLWQHVWRRRSINVDGSLLHSEDEIVPLREAEANNQIIESIDRAQTDYEFIQKQTDIQRSSIKADEEEAAGKASLSSCSFALNPSPTENAEHEISRKDENCAAKEAIDLIGILQNHKQSHYCIDSSSHHHSSNLDYPLQLDLCLKRTAPHGDDGSVLAVKQSGGNSAFSRYINKTLHTEREVPHDFNRYSSDTPSPALSTPKSILSLSNTQQSQQPLPLSQHRSLPASVPVIVLRSDSSCTDFASEKTVAQQGFNQILHRNNNGHTLESLRLDALRDKANFYPSNIGTGNVNRVFHMTPGEEGLMIPDGNSQHSLLQREALLMKFRLKRKLRCFDKKVRYESRKKLAEKRPRVKGQFVRHVNVDTVP